MATDYSEGVQTLPTLLGDWSILGVAFFYSLVLKIIHIFWVEVLSQTCDFTSVFSGSVGYLFCFPTVSFAEQSF